MHDNNEERLVAAAPEDADAVRDLVRAAFARWVPVIGREPRPMLADYGHAIREHRIDLLLAGRSLVGIIETVMRDGCLWVETVAVTPGSQGKGHGRRLLEHAERLASAAGLPRVELLTNGAFASNVALYERLGYRVTRREPFMGGETLYFSKAIGQAVRS